MDTNAKPRKHHNSVEQVLLGDLRNLSFEIVIRTGPSHHLSIEIIIFEQQHRAAGLQRNAEAPCAASAKVVHDERHDECHGKRHDERPLILGSIYLNIYTYIYIYIYIMILNHMLKLTKLII